MAGYGRYDRPRARALFPVEKVHVLFYHINFGGRTVVPTVQRNFPSVGSNRADIASAQRHSHAKLAA